MASSEISEEDLAEYNLSQTVENPADALAETIVGDTKREPVRRISLEPSSYEG